MREILFRGKRTDTGEWVYGSLDNVCADKCRILQHNRKHGQLWNVRVFSKTVGQYTGLTDRNGKRIFEGDIIGYGLRSCVVRYDTENGRYMLYENNSYKVDGFNVDTMQLKKAIEKINTADIQPIPPFYNNPTITTLAQQLNNLIDRYNTIYSIYTKPFFGAEEQNPAKRLVKVLENIEKAIDALCFHLTTFQGILTIK